MRINIWISHEGLISTSCSGLEFPYKAISVVTNKKKVYESIEDVYDEIVALYNISNEQGFDVGHSLYSQCAFFADYELLLDSGVQNRIKEYNYCKAFSVPPDPSMQETPVEIIEDFMTIEHECNKIKEIRNKELKNGK